MKFVEPKVFHMGQTGIDPEGIQAYLEHIGVPDWKTDAPSDAETLMEIAGRGCYQSFDVSLNENLTRVREGNQTYMDNILNVQHGSVIEHAQDTFMYCDVSRVFTHELVRHRLAGYSQESLRFVRLTELKGYFPGVYEQPFLDKVNTYLEEKELAGLDIDEKWMRNFFRETFEQLEERQRILTKELRLDDLGSFSDKKKLTSANRRMAPIGLATSIMGSCNHRTWRFVIQQRTSRHAEEEIRLVFGEVFRKLRALYPNVYQDATVEEIDGFDEVTFKNHKI